MKKQMYSKDILIPDLKDFEKAYPTFSMIAKGKGKFLFNLVMQPETFIQAMILTEYGMPAVNSIAEICYNEAKKRKGFIFSGRIKQYIGAMIALLMTSNGYKKTGIKKSIFHKNYTRGEFYIKNNHLGSAKK
jgi:hypothetical protein